MSAETIDQQIIKHGERRQLGDLQKILLNTSIKVLQTALKAKMGRSDCITFWNYLLLGFDPKNYELREKRFACVKFFLEQLLQIELSYKQTFDLVMRLCQELETFTGEELVEIYELCNDGIRLGDPKCVGWKDLMPETIKVLETLPEVMVNGVTMTGIAFRDSIINNLCTMRWPSEVLTPIANMFRELTLSNAELDLILKKFAGLFDALAPMELPALCFQVFSLCKTAAKIIVPLLALERYFHRYLYKKLFADMDSNSSDFDSIDKFSDRELREAQETILYHLNYCTQYQITELQMCAVLRNFQAMPDTILTPFMLSAIITMTAANREPDTTRLSASSLLPFLRSVIKNNEDERILSNHSIWCRETLIRKEVDLKQIFKVLIDQNKEGKDVITPGLVNLAFVLLKTRNNEALNNLAINFLVHFVRKRFVFGLGIVQKVAYWMVVEPDQRQYSECLVQLSVADTFTVSECTKTINFVMDFFLQVHGEQAMHMMGFILPIIKISPMVRDALIEILNRAMKSAYLKTRRMAIYGFCMILKQLNNSNSQRSQTSSSSASASFFCTQQNTISGYSLMSQATLGNQSNPQRHFNMLTLEIIGVLRNCFSQTVDIKTTLYENLQRAVELNSKLAPHVLQFIDWHFRSFFVAPAAFTNEADYIDETEFRVEFDKIVKANDLEQHEILVKDNLGKLVLFVSHCLEIFEKFESDYDTREMKRLLQMSIEKILTKKLKFEEMTGSLTHFKYALCAQQINFIEGLMAYLILNSKQTNTNVKSLGPLFKEQQKLIEALKKSAANTKKNQKKSNKDDTTMAPNITINGAVVSKIELEFENIWDLEVIEKFLRLLHEDIVPFASPSNTTSLRSNVELVRYVLEVTIKKVEAIALAPEYKQLSHSKRTLKYLTDITKVIYERCIKRLLALWRDFDMKTATLAAECFQKCLQTANKVYKKSFVTLFVKGFDIQAHQQPRELPTTLHSIVDEYMKEHLQDAETSDHAKILELERLPAALLLSLEVIYENMQYDDSMTTESYSWLLKFCHENVVQTRQLSIVLKLLFTQRLKTHAGEFFVHVVKQFARVLGLIDDHVEEEMETNTQNADLKAINWQTLPHCYQFLYDALRKQIDDVEYFILKANNALYKLRIVADMDRDVCLSSLRSLQRSICTQMNHIAKALFELANVRSSLGACMDGLLRLFTQFYNCLKNLTKHFLTCVPNVTVQGSKFDLLLHEIGKTLPKRIYALITYIDANLIESDAEKNTQTQSNKRGKKINPKVAKEKVLREAKPVSKLILCMENFNKHVILLSKKASNDRLVRFMHLGVVRDFRLQNKALQKAIERTLSHSSQISQSSIGSEEQEGNDEDGTEVEAEAVDEVNASTINRADSENGNESETEADANDDDNVNDENENNGVMEDDDHASVNTASSKRSTISTTEINNDADDDDNTSVTTVTKRLGSTNLRVRSASSRCLQRLIADKAAAVDDDDSASSLGSKTPTPPDGEEILKDSESNTASQLIRNVKKINKRAQKRALAESEQNNLEPDVATIALPPKKRGRRGRSTK